MSESTSRELSGDLKQHERLNRLLEILADQGRISVHDAVATFGVSGATIRRDLDHLASRQLLRRTRGGAVAMLAYDLPLGYKADKSVDARQRIGAAAASTVEAGEVIGIAGGPIALEVARALGARPEFMDQVEVITIFTNSVNVAYELSTRPHIKLLVTGGTVRPRSSSMAGDIAKSSIRRYRFDRLFLEADGITVEGPSVRDNVIAEFLAEFVERSQRTVVLTEQATFGTAAFATICDMDRVSTIITDTDHAPATLGGADIVGV